MMIVTIYSLFCDDIRLLAFTLKDDPTFTVLTSIALCLFTIEISLGAIGSDGYAYSFFFWLDIVSTVSLITDIQPIMDHIVGNSQQAIKNEDEERETGELARASRGARMGTKAGRIVRVVRLIRLIRVIKLFKGAHQLKSNV